MTRNEAVMTWRAVCGSDTVMTMPPTGRMLEDFATRIEAAERERICAAIKAEDDHACTGDYMLDSDDCIAVARGTWERTDFGGPDVGAKLPAAAAPAHENETL